MNEQDFIKLQKDVEELKKAIGTLNFPLDVRTKTAIENTRFSILTALLFKSDNQGWTDMTASRAKDTVYANGVKPLLVLATFRCAITAGGGNAYVQAKSDGLSTPTTVASGKVGIEAGLNGEDNNFQIAFFVNPGANYSIASSATNGTVTLGKWIEVIL